MFFMCFNNFVKWNFFKFSLNFLNFFSSIPRRSIKLSVELITKRNIVFISEILLMRFQVIKKILITKAESQNFLSPFGKAFEPEAYTVELVPEWKINKWNIS